MRVFDPKPFLLHFRPIGHRRASVKQVIIVVGHDHVSAVTPHNDGVVSL